MAWNAKDPSDQGPLGSRSEPVIGAFSLSHSGPKLLSQATLRFRWSELLRWAAPHGPAANPRVGAVRRCSVPDDCLGRSAI